MSRFEKNRRTFRPTIEGTILEDRVVLSQGSAVVAAATSGVTTFTRPMIRAAYNDQIRAAFSVLRGVISSQQSQLYRNGTPTADQLGSFRANVQGAIDATAFRLSSQAALLPGSENLVSQVQNAMFSDRWRQGMFGKLDAILSHPRVVNSASSFNNNINAMMTRAINSVSQSVDKYMNTARLTRLSVDAQGNRIGLRNYMAQQVVNQYVNTNAALAQSYGTALAALQTATSGTGATGATSTGTSSGNLAALTSGQVALGNQLLGALGLSTYQLSNNLALFPGSSSLTNALQSSLYGTNSTATSLFNGLTNLPTTGTLASNVNTAFTSGLSGIVNSLNGFLGQPSTQNFTLPAGTVPSIFASNFSNLGAGFNNGFGSNFLGFGQPSTGMTSSISNFGTGFNTTPLDPTNR